MLRFSICGGGAGMCISKAPWADWRRKWQLFL